MSHIANVNLLVIHHYFYLTSNISSYINKVNKFQKIHQLADDGRLSEQIAKHPKRVLVGMRHRS